MRKNGAEHISVKRNATIGAARRLHFLAGKELSSATTFDGERQAAEKMWGSMMTAARAVLRCAGQRGWAKTQGVVDRLSRWEKATFKNVRLGNQMRLLQVSAHGACFYAGDESRCNRPALEAALKITGEQIDQAETLCEVARGRR